MARTFEIKKEKTALLIIDLQNDFIRKGAPLYVDSAYETLAPVRKLLDFARSKEMPVIFARFVSGKTPTLLWNWSPEIKSDNCCKRGHERYYADIDKTLQCSETVDELLPYMPSDYVIEKYNYSVFRNTNLKDILHSEDVDTLIVTGTVTQVCVEDTVHDGFAEGYKMVVAEDCVSSWDEVQHRATLDNIAHKFGMVSHSQDLMDLLK